MLRNSLQLARISLRASTPRIPFRSLTKSTVRFAKEPENPGYQSFTEPSDSLYDRLHSSPAALEAMEALSSIISKKTGVDLRGGDAPSMKMMLALAQDEELKAAAQKLMQALRDSGIEVDPRQAFEALKVMGTGFEKVGDFDDIAGSGFNEGNGESEDDGKGKKPK